MGGMPQVCLMGAGFLLNYRYTRARMTPNHDASGTWCFSWAYGRDAAPWGYDQTAYRAPRDGSAAGVDGGHDASDQHAVLRPSICHVRRAGRHPSNASDITIRGFRIYASAGRPTRHDSTSGPWHGHASPAWECGHDAAATHARSNGASTSWRVHASTPRRGISSSRSPRGRFPSPGSPRGWFPSPGSLRGWFPSPRSSRTSWRLPWRRPSGSPWPPRPASPHPPVSHHPRRHRHSSTAAY